MKRHVRAPGRRALAWTVLGALAIPAAATAQRRPDFLFHTPKATLGLRVGYSLPSVAGEIFDFTLDTLTANRSDFASAAIAGELALRITPRLDFAFDLGFTRWRAPTEYRHWVDNNDLPIRQTTEFRRVPVTGGLKLYLVDRGRSIGRFAWIPNRWAPFVGAGAGLVWYHFEQSGDFVDYDDLDVFSDTYRSEGHTPIAQVFGGADWSLSRDFLLTVEGRYSWARTDMGPDFANPDGTALSMDLAGFQATAGISVRF